MPSLVPVHASLPPVPERPVLEWLRNEKPDPRVVIYDSVELFSYTRDIDSLNVSWLTFGLSVYKIEALTP